MRVKGLGFKKCCYVHEIKGGVSALFDTTNSDTARDCKLILRKCVSDPFLIAIESCDRIFVFLIKMTI